MLEQCPKCNNSMFEFEKDRWMCRNYKDLFERKSRSNDLTADECDFFFDKDGFEYMLNELSNKVPKGFYAMSNEPLADAYFTVLSKTNSDVLLVKQGISQYFAISSNGKKHMLKLFKKHKNDLQADLLEVETGLEKINSNNL